MAQKILVTVTDDLDGTEGARTIPFALDGTAYEIDLAGDNEKKFRADLSPYTASARTVHADPKRTGKGKYPSRTSAGRERGAAIRAWAKDRGYKVSDRGRVPAQVIAEYDAAH